MAEILYRNSEGNMVIRDDDGQINVYRKQQVVVEVTERLCFTTGELVRLRAALAELSMEERARILGDVRQRNKR